MELRVEPAQLRSTRPCALSRSPSGPPPRSTATSTGTATPSTTSASPDYHDRVEVARTRSSRCTRSTSRSPTCATRRRRPRRRCSTSSPSGGRSSGPRVSIGSPRSSDRRRRPARRAGRGDRTAAARALHLPDRRHRLPLDHRAHPRGGRRRLPGLRPPDARPAAPARDSVPLRERLSPRRARQRRAFAEPRLDRGAHPGPRLGPLRPHPRPHARRALRGGGTRAQLRRRGAEPGRLPRRGHRAPARGRTDLAIRGARPRRLPAADRVARRAGLSGHPGLGRGAPRGAPEQQEQAAQQQQ